MADEDVVGPSGEAEGEEPPYWVEVWNDYDPSMRFVSIFPVGEKEGAIASSVAYYIIEPGKHTGLHSDNVEEIVFVAEGEGEVFSIGGSKKLEPGKFFVLAAGIEHDVYAHGTVAMRLLSFFPATEVLSTFQQEIYPVGGNVLSSKPPAPTLTELDPSNLPEDFPFSLEELGLAEAGSEGPRELTRTERLIGMTEPGTPPENVEVRVSEPGTGRWLVGPAGGELRYEDEIEEKADDDSEVSDTASEASEGDRPSNGV
jgi:quercetin dioxygenase-like cupin family protein